MKKIFTSLTLAALAVSSAYAAPPIFSADLSTFSQDDFSAWTVLDINEDNSTWGYSADAAPSRVFYSYNSTNASDDWLISPAISIPTDGTYVVSYNFKGSSYGEAFDVWTGNAPTVDGMTEKIASHNPVFDTESGNLAFIDAKAGTVYIGFHCTSQADKFRLYITNVSLLEASNPVDIAVSQIVSPVTGEGLGEETVTVAVSNLGRADLDSFDVAYSIDGGDAVVEHVTTPLAIGQTINYSFNTKADLTVGHKTYTIKAWTQHPDDLNPANDATETKVRHIAPATVPYFTGFEPDEDTSGMTFLNLNNDSGDWGINIDSAWFKMSRSGFGSLCYNYDSNNNADDWAILEPIKMEAGNYVIKFWYSATKDHPERLKVFYGTSADPASMTNLVAEYNPVENETYREAIHIIEIKEDADIYFGFYCFSDANENWLCIDDVSIDKVDADSFDMIVGEITSPALHMRDGNLRNIDFTLQNVGIIDATTTVNIYLDGNIVMTKDYSLRPTEILNVSETGLLDNLQDGTHTLKIEATADQDNNLDNNVQELTFKYLEKAVRLWDFEDGQLPADLTLRVEDSAVNHPDAGEEFNEDGFGIFNIEHPVLGKHALAVNTWFTESRSADRWIVLPQMTVTGDNASFVWNSNSYSPDYPEKYSVKISKGNDYWTDYSTVFSVDNEYISPQTRGIELGDYKGETIYVAINVTTYNGEVFLLDNLGVYGDVSFDSTGIKSVNGAGSLNIVIEPGRILVNSDNVDSLAVYSLDGKIMAESADNKLDISGLARGIYTVRAVTAEGTKTVKFVK